MMESQFPPGTPVCVRQVVEHRIQDIETEVVGVIEAWTDEPTGAWHAHGKQPPIFENRGAPMGGGTVAIDIGRELVIGSFAGDRVIRAPKAAP